MISWICSRRTSERSIPNYQFPVGHTEYTCLLFTRRGKVLVQYLSVRLLVPVVRKARGKSPLLRKKNQKTCSKLALTCRVLFKTCCHSFRTHHAYQVGDPIFVEVHSASLLFRCQRSILISCDQMKVSSLPSDQ